MKSSTLKRVGLGVGILLIGAIGGYILATHQMQHRNRGLLDDMSGRQRFNHGGRNAFFEDFDRNFDEMEKYFENERKDMEERWKDFDKEFSFGDLTGDYNSKGSFSYYEKKNVNGDESSYDANGNWREGSKTGDIIVNGTNLSGKEFSYSGSLKDGKSEGIIIDEDGNAKNLSLDNIDFGEIYESSNNLNE